MEQERLKPDPPKLFGIHLDSKLTLQTRRRYFGSAPKNTEELRAKYEVMSNMWLLAQLRQPGRSLFSDLQPTTFQRILKQLLGKEDFGLKKKLQGKFLTAPCGEHCMSYELELRRDAHKQCHKSTIGISAAWWSACRSQLHRMMHWLQLVSLSKGVFAHNVCCPLRGVATSERTLAGARAHHDGCGAASPGRDTNTGHPSSTLLSLLLRSVTLTSAEICTSCCAHFLQQTQGCA